MNSTVQDEIRLISTQLEHLNERAADRAAENRALTVDAIVWSARAVCVLLSSILGATPATDAAVENAVRRSEENLDNAEGGTL